MSGIDARNKPWEHWPEVGSALRGGQVKEPQTPKIAVSEVVQTLAPRTHTDTARMQRAEPTKDTICAGVIVNESFAKGYRVGNPQDKEAAVNQPKTARTVSLYERVSRIEHSLEKVKGGVEAISNDLTKGVVTRTLEAAAQAVEAKLPPTEPKIGDTVWLKSRDTGQSYIVIGEEPEFRVEGAHLADPTKKTSYVVRALIVRKVGDGKVVGVPAGDASLVRPAFPTLTGRLVKGAFVLLGLTTLLTATLAYGRMALDRAARGPENVAPVKTSTNF